MGFLKIMATPCTGTGATSTEAPPIEMYLNIDQIAAIKVSAVLLTAERVIIKLGTSFYTDLKLADGQRIPMES
jgi:hypothetical protein